MATKAQKAPLAHFGSAADRGGLTGLQRVLLLLVVTVHGSLWWRAVHWYPRLPERIPMHFDAAGRPDGWATVSAANWFLLPGVAAALLLLFGALAWFVGGFAVRTPSLCNMPKKHLFVALSPAGRQAVMAPTRSFLLWLLVLLGGLFLWIVEGQARVATGDEQTLATWPVFGFLIGVFAMLAPYLVATSRRIDAEARREGVLPPG